MTPAEATSKARADFLAGAKDEALYNLCDMATGVGLAYRNGWRGARIAAENAGEAQNQPAAPEKPTVTAPIACAMVENVDECPFEAAPVSISSTSIEAPKTDTPPPVKPDLAPEPVKLAPPILPRKTGQDAPTPPPRPKREPKPEPAQLDLFA